MSLDSRVTALEALLHAVPSNIPPSELTGALARVRTALSGIPGSALYRVPPHYYSLPLRARARILCCSPHQLCKTLIFESPVPFAGGPSHNLVLKTLIDSGVPAADAPKPLPSRVAVVVQYTHRLDISALQRALGAPGLALAADGARLAGFLHNGVSPFGMAAAIPVVWCKGALAGGGAVWVGGGEPDVKARVFAGALQKSGAAPAVVLDVSVPRSEEEWEGE